MLFEYKMYLTQIKRRNKIDKDKKERNSTSVKIDRDKLKSDSLFPSFDIFHL
jgi:hypothetical protein